jgi:hypothetical protein
VGAAFGDHFTGGRFDGVGTETGDEALGWLGFGVGEGFGERVGM